MKIPIFPLVYDIVETPYRGSKVGLILGDYDLSGYQNPADLVEGSSDVAVREGDMSEAGNIRWCCTSCFDQQNGIWSSQLALKKARLMNHVLACVKTPICVFVFRRQDEEGKRSSIEHSFEALLCSVPRCGLSVEFLAIQMQLSC